MGCIERDGNWACLTDCHHHQNFGDWMYLTFEAKVSGTTQDFRPRIKLVKKWPGHSSQTLELTGALVDGGQLSEDTWTRVVIPMGKYLQINILAISDLRLPCGMLLKKKSIHHFDTD